MGKCKQRILARARSINDAFRMSRIQAVNVATSNLCIDPHSVPARNLISLFGLSEEELSESGVSYEVLRSLKALMI